MGGGASHRKGILKIDLHDWEKKAREWPKMGVAEPYLELSLSESLSCKERKPGNLPGSLWDIAQR